MWARSQETNQHGEPVLLLQPVRVDRGRGSDKHRSKGAVRSTNPSTSHIGGLPCRHPNDALLPTAGADAHIINPNCSICSQPMHLLIQLHAPLDAVDRTLYVFGCNDASCHSGTGGKNADAGDDAKISRFHACIGADANGGALRCLRSQQPWTEPSKSTSEKAERIKEAPTTNTLESNDWGMDDGSDGWGDDTDDWGGGEVDASKDNKDLSMDDLENLLTKCEMKSSAKSEQAASTKAPSGKVPVSGDSVSNTAGGDMPPSFEYHVLEMFDEPHTGRGADDGDGDGDDEDEEDEFANVDSSKVDQLLSRYLETEDDNEILSALKGGGNSNAAAESSGKDGGGGERYERLPPEERAFIAFTNRLKRAPRQVARYAYGGMPLWSVPLPPTNTGKRQPRSKQQRSKKKPQKAYSPMPDVPDCICGAKRVFEFQLLPSLLHALDVDSYAKLGTQNHDGGDVMDLITSGGMNWGSLAVYSCSNSCDKSREEFIIYQDSCFDEQVKKSEGGTGVGKDDEDMED